MAYVNYEYYKNLYSNPEISENDFNRYVFDACKKIDYATSGADGVKKLRIAYPTNEEDAESVKRCVIAVINAMYKIEESEKNARNSKGYIERQDGTIHGKVVTAISSGNESISFSTSGNASLIDKALADPAVQKKMYIDIITEYLSGVEDANGVNLLYMGHYPY